MNLRKTVEFWRRPLAGSLRLHLKEPDYTRPLLQMSGEQKQRILDKLVLLYGEERSRHCFSEVERLMQAHYARKPLDMIAYERTFNPADRFTERCHRDYLCGHHSQSGSDTTQTLYHVLSLFSGGRSTRYISFRFSRLRPIAASQSSTFPRSTRRSAPGTTSSA
jgi:hypothetical protein